MLNLSLGLDLFQNPQVSNGSFRPKLPFVFREIEGTIREGFAKGNGSYCRVLAVLKGRRGGSIFDTPFETQHVKAPPEFQLRKYHRPIGQLKANTSATAGAGYTCLENLVLRQRCRFLKYH
jgi:hypothetical protein